MTKTLSKAIIHSSDGFRGDGLGRGGGGVKGLTSHPSKNIGKNCCPSSGRGRFCSTILNSNQMLNTNLSHESLKAFTSRYDVPIAVLGNLEFVK